VPADPASQRALEERIQSDPDYHDASGKQEKVQKITGETGRELQDVSKNVFIAVAGMQGVSKLYPPPELYEFKSAELRAEHIISGDKQATAIVASSAALKAPKAERNVLIAHEIAHTVIEANPDLLLHYVPPNLQAVREDLRQKHIPEDFRSLRYAQYMSELLADDIAIRATKDPAALASLVSRGADDRKQVMADYIDKAMKKEEKTSGHRFSDDEKKAFTERMTAQLDNPAHKTHPDDKVRIEAAQLVEKQMQQASDKENELVAPLPAPSAKTASTQPLPKR